MIKEKKDFIEMLEQSNSKSTTRISELEHENNNLRCNNDVIKQECSDMNQIICKVDSYVKNFTKRFDLTIDQD